jgi:retinol dehydrogenase-12
MGQIKIPPTPASLDLSGKTIIVTGANNGLGLESARQYLVVLHAARVILAVRTLSKGEEAARYLSGHPTVKEANPTAEVLVMELDLDDYESVLNFTENVKDKFDVLDIVLLSGGVNIMNY